MISVVGSMVLRNAAIPSSERLYFLLLLLLFVYLLFMLQILVSFPFLVFLLFPFSSFMHSKRTETSSALPFLSSSSSYSTPSTCICASAYLTPLMLKLAAKR